MWNLGLISHPMKCPSPAPTHCEEIFLHPHWFVQYQDGLEGLISLAWSAQEATFGVSESPATSLISYHPEYWLAVERHAAKHSQRANYDSSEKMVESKRKREDKVKPKDGQWKMRSNRAPGRTKSRAGCAFWCSSIRSNDNKYDHFYINFRKTAKPKKS